LLDNKLPKGCHSLGWAFAVLDHDSEVIMAAHGVPPKWVDTIQGAELWAVQMALAEVVLPQRLWTDCQTVKLGLGRPSEWAGSSKRKFARIWNVVRAQVDDIPDAVQWMPAHVSESSVGHVKASVGRVTHDMWCANQICDILCKESAESVRVPEATRVQLTSRRKQLGELLVYLAHLTVAANGLKLPDGSFLRDSTAVKSFRIKRGIVLPGRGVVKQTAPTHAKFHWSVGFRRRATRQRGAPAPKPRKSCNASRLIEGVEARKEADFQHWWRESRSQSLRPRDPEALTAHDRREALRLRLASRGVFSKGEGD